MIDWKWTNQGPRDVGKNGRYGEHIKDRPEVLELRISVQVWGMAMEIGSSLGG